MGHTPVALETAFPVGSVNVLDHSLMTADAVALDNPAAPFCGPKYIRRREGVFVIVPCSGISFVDQSFCQVVFGDVAVPAVNMHFLAVNVVKRRFISRLHDVAGCAAVLIGGCMFKLIANEQNKD